jgi:hypothetical protein
VADPKRLCVLTPDASYDENWSKDAALLERLIGSRFEYRPWTSPGDLSGFGLILPLLAWGYQRMPSRWFASLDQWEAGNLPFANPVALLRWNTDKDYLLDLEAAGVAIVPTLETHCLTNTDLEQARARFGCETLIIKPSISAGADGTYRLAPGEAVPFAVLEREMLIQPMMEDIVSEGEFSLFYFDGAFSHAILKRPAHGDFRVQEQFGGREVPVDPPRDACTLAEAALAALPALPLYARVDIVRDGRGQFKLMELELIEPSLFLHHAPDDGAQFGEALRARL